MAKLVKIKDVVLTTTTQAGSHATAACDAARALLTAEGIKFRENWYNDPSVDERTPVLKALSSWTWKGPRQRVFTEFPILHWTECSDDWSTEVDHAAGLDEIRVTPLIANKSLVE